MKASALGFKRIVVKYDVFKHEIECLIGPRKNIGKYVAYRHWEPDSTKDFEVAEDSIGFFFFGKGDLCPPIIWLPRFPRTPSEYEALSHEVAHAVIDMLESRGVPITKGNDETFCYALGYGVKTILEAR